MTNSQREQGQKFRELFQRLCERKVQIHEGFLIFPAKQLRFLGCQGVKGWVIIFIFCRNGGLGPSLGVLWLGIIWNIDLIRTEITVSF